MSGAWSLAHDAAAEAGIELRPCESVADADRIRRVMGATWGDATSLPPEVIRALAVSGNVPYGAFSGPTLVGFVLGWAGVDAGGLHVHSHMLAALPDRRRRGVGYALKLAQRAQVLDQGIGVVRWTFDPLVLPNAHFNLHKLGAVADRFDRDFYGSMDDDLNRGDRSDRLTVRWDLEQAPGPRQIPSGAIEVEAPSDHRERRERDAAGAAERREAFAVRAEALFADAFEAAGFDRDRSTYLFVPAGGA